MVTGSEEGLGSTAGSEPPGVSSAFEGGSEPAVFDGGGSDRGSEPAVSDGGGSDRESEEPDDPTLAARLWC